MYTSIQNFKNEFQQENELTLKIFRAIANDKITLKPNDNIRSMQRLAWHITLTLGEMISKTGLVIDCPHEHEASPARMEDICEVYAKAAASVMSQIEMHWKDADLNTLVPMYGEEWSKGTILSVLVKHEIHHRGQLTVMMRMHNLKVPGIYGPSKEEWAAWNMPAME